jgi:hypothetical protein
MSITVKEFKMWLEGVEEMQADDWCPSKVQWDKIRAKIRDLDDQVVVKSQALKTASADLRQRQPTDGAVPMDFNIPPDPNSLEGMDIPSNVTVGRSSLAPGIAPGHPVPTGIPSSSAPFATGSATVPTRTPSDISGKPYAPPFV